MTSYRLNALSFFNFKPNSLFYFFWLLMGNSVCGIPLKEDLEKSEVISPVKRDKTEKVLLAILFIQAFIKARKLRRNFKKKKEEEMLNRLKRFFDSSVNEKWNKNNPPIPNYPIQSCKPKELTELCYFYGKTIILPQKKEKYLGQVNGLNVPCGIGVLVSSDGSCYEGGFINGIKEGKGRIFHPSFEFYEGEWQDGVPHGQGKYKFKDNSIYEGEWQEGQPHGKGKETKENETYEGHFERGKRNGEGKLRTKEFVYVGGFQENMFSGKGKIEWEDGERYKGDWFMGKMHGFGVFEWKDGKKFRGKFEFNKKHGKGTLILPSGNQIEGEWANGKFVQGF